MANWAKVSADLEDRFALLSKSENMLEFEIANGSRAQTVVITHLEGPEGSWLSMFSPICTLDEVPADKVLIEAETALFGVWTVGNFYGLVHSMPIANLDANELDEPLKLIVKRADSLERKLTGRDDL